MTDPRRDLADGIGQRPPARGPGEPALLAALWTCTQFWRAGEAVDTGESAS